MKIIKIMLLGFVLSLSQCLWAQSSPVPMLQSTAESILETLKKNKSSLKSNHQIIFQAVEQHLLPNVDVMGMSRSVLGRQAWMKATPGERNQFSQAFTKLVIRTYAGPLAEYTDEKVKFMPVKGSLDGRFVRVNSVIIRPSGQTIPLVYSMVAQNGQWKIYDLSVEGVSLLQSFRSQFSQALQNGSMQELINQLSKQGKAA